jgi:large subunit ribosomal protein L9
MSLEVILMDDVQFLGKIGDTVTVRDGYARNYLLPKGLAEPLTKNALRKLEKIRKEREELLKIRKAEAMDKAGKLKGQTLTIAVKAVEGDEEGKLYGSVTAADIAKALTEAGVAVDAAMVKLEEPIKNLGTTDLTIALMADITVTLKLAVIAE